MQHLIKVADFKKMMTVQHAAITNPKLADRILRFLLSEETTAFPARILSQRILANAAEVEEHIIAINHVKARWIYEIPQPEGKESFYIIGNCKMQIREHLRRGGFQHLFESGIDAFEIKPWATKRQMCKGRKLLTWRKAMLITFVVTLIATALFCLTCL